MAVREVIHFPFRAQPRLEPPTSAGSPTQPVSELPPQAQIKLSLRACADRATVIVALRLERLLRASHSRFREYLGFSELRR